ncbi:MAG: sigma-70 family RNA polymerase sigma factor [Kiritimatiellae bacterium]|nr:sigma-70 family RNA polymerase sigma factor [Kiritimatiellia bacterium]
MSDPQDGRNEVFFRIIRHRAQLMAVIVAMVRDFDVAEDLFQDTVVEIVNSFPTFEPDRDFLKWAKGIARHVVLHHWRRAARRPVAVAEETLVAMADLLIDEPEEETWEQEKVGFRRCMERLSPRHRLLMFLRYGENLKGAVLAERAKLNLKSLRTTLLRVRSFLRECVRRQIRGVIPDMDGSW